MKASVASLCATLTLFVAGCSSEGYRVDLKPEEAQSAIKSAKGKYFIASLRYMPKDPQTPAAGDLVARNIDVFNPDHGTTRNAPDKQELLRAALLKSCRERFPSLFAADGEQAIPIEVTINGFVADQQMIGPMICGFTLGLVPGPYSMDRAYEIDVGPCQAAPPGHPRRVMYVQEGWAALFPTGLIPYCWSKTDEPPKCYSLSNIEPYLKMVNGRTISLFADAVALELSMRHEEFAGVPEVMAGNAAVSMFMGVTVTPSSYSPPASDASTTTAGTPGGGGSGIVAPVHEPQNNGLGGL